MIYGYVRVSTKEQKELRQVMALKEFGVVEKNIFLDKQSRKDFQNEVLTISDTIKQIRFWTDYANTPRF